MKKIIVFLALIIVLFISLIFIQKINSTNRSTTIKEVVNMEVDNTQLKKVLSKKETTFVYFYTPVCQYCKRAKPKILNSAKKINLDILEFNLLNDKESKNESSWEIYNIEYTPTIVVFKQGKEIGRLIGDNSKNTFEDFFNDYK